LMNRCDNTFDGWNWRSYYNCAVSIKNNHWRTCEWGEQRRLENMMGYIGTNMKMNKEWGTAGGQMVAVSSTFLVVTSLLAYFFTN